LTPPISKNETPRCRKATTRTIEVEFNEPWWTIGRGDVICGGGRRSPPREGVSRQTSPGTPFRPCPFSFDEAGNWMESFMVENNIITRFPDGPKEERNSLSDQLQRVLLPSKEKTSNLSVGSSEESPWDPIMIFSRVPDPESIRTCQEEMLHGFIGLATQRA